MRTVLSVTGVLLGLHVSVVAFAQEDAQVSDVESLLARAQFDEVDQAARKALASGTLAAGSAARVYLAQGTIAAARSHPEEAESFFRKALAVDRDIALPASAGPHVVERFMAAAKVRGEKPPLSLIVNKTPDRDPSRVLIDIDVLGDSEGLADRVVLHRDGVDEQGTIQRSGIHFVETIPEAHGCISLVVGLLDQWGNELWPALARETLCRAATPTVPAASAVVADQGSSRRRLAAGYWVLAGASTGGLAIATAILGLQALDRRADFNRANADPNETVSRRNSLKDTTLTLEHAATLTGIATVGAAAATVALWATQSGRAGYAAVGVGPVAGGGSVLLSGTF